MILYIPPLCYSPFFIALDMWQRVTLVWECVSIVVHSFLAFCFHPRDSKAASFLISISLPEKPLFRPMARCLLVLLLPSLAACAPPGYPP